MRIKRTRVGNAEIVEEYLSCPYPPGEYLANLTIQIFGKTRLKDVKEAWKEITQKQKALNDYKGKNKKKKNTERDKKILNFSMKERNTSKIYNLLSPNGTSELDEGTIRKIISRSRRQEGIKPPWRKKEH